MSDPVYPPPAALGTVHVPVESPLLWSCPPQCLEAPHYGHAPATSQKHLLWSYKPQNLQEYFFLIFFFPLKHPPLHTLRASSCNLCAAGRLSLLRPSHTSFRLMGLLPSQGIPLHPASTPGTHHPGLLNSSYPTMTHGCFHCYFRAGWPAALAACPRSGGSSFPKGSC